MTYRELGSSPISKESPAGDPIRYEKEFDDLQRELDKLSSPTTVGSVDWKYVLKASSAILEKRSKDLLVASYYAVSEVNQNNFEGLLKGLTVLYDLINTHWEKMYPAHKRMRGRVGAIEWWLERTEKEFERIEISPISSDLFKRIKEKADGLELLISKNFPDPPIMRPLRRVIDSLTVSDKESKDLDAEIKEKTGNLKPSAVPEKKSADEPAIEKTAPQPDIEKKSPDKSQSPPEAPPQKKTTTVEKTPPVGESSDTLESEQDAKRMMSATMLKLRKISSYYASNDPTHPLAYQLKRISVWGTLESLPPEKEGITSIPSPPPQVLETFERFRKNGNYIALVQATEQKLSQYIFWLDLNRFSMEALSFLGMSYQNALESIIQETAYFIERFPDILKLSFQDGTPFANPETITWLQSIRFSSGGNFSEENTVTEVSSEEDDMVLKEVRELVSKNQLADAVSILQGKIRFALGGKEAAMWRVHLAKILLKKRKHEIALPILERILEDMDAHQLDRWEPAFALQALNTIYVGFHSHQDSQIQKEAAMILNRMAKIDAAYVLKIT